MKSLTLLFLILSHAAFGQCGGEERWSIKTLADSDTNKITDNGLITTVSRENSIARPVGKWLSLPRQTNESQVLTITGDIVECGIESDEDYHLVLKNGDETIICEIPNPDCIPGNPHNKEFAAARDFIDNKLGKKPGHSISPIAPFAVTIRGVGFWDKPAHGQGHAVNGREIHPCLQIQ